MPEALTAPQTLDRASAAVRGAALGWPAFVLPETVVENGPIAAQLGVDERWIVERTGIVERRAVRPDERLSDLAAAAGRSTLARAALDGADVDLVLVGTTTQDALMPNAAPLVAHELGAAGAGAIDVGAACTAFVSALALGAAQIEARRADTVLVIGADVLTRYLDRGDRRTAALFGDGAGAVLMTAAAPGRVGPVVMRTDGSLAELIEAPFPEPTIRMQGHETFREAVARLAEVTTEALTAAEVESDDVDLFVYHQANRRITRAVGQRLGLSSNRVVDCIERYGNTSAASIPIALALAESEGRLTDGARVLVAAFGAGLTWGAAVVEWGYSRGGDDGP